jgi:hypothetical protein
MNLDFQQILKRTGLFFCEMPPIKSEMVAISSAKPVANGFAGRNYNITVYERKAFINFDGWISKNLVKLGQTQSDLIRLNPAKSNLIQPNPTEKLAWTAPAWFKAGMEMCNP